MKWRITAFILALLLLLPAAAGAAAQVNFHFSWGESGSTAGVALVKNGITFVPITYLKDYFQIDESWDSSGKQAQFDGWNKSFAVRVGSLTGVLDGKIVKLEGAPFVFKEKLYLPARFVVRALNGGNLTWDARTKTVKADHLHTFKKYKFAHEGFKYAVEGKSGNLYVTDSSGVQRELAKLGTSIKEFLSFSFQKTPGGLLVLRLLDNYGEPHLNTQLFTLVMKDGRVIRQSSVHYWNRFEQNVTYADGQLLLIDGKTLRLIEDGTGKVIETIDLVKLGGEEDDYFIEYFDKDVFLLRANGNGIMKLVDRDTETITVLYKELFDGKQLEYAEFNDTPYAGDFLRLLKREGEVLYFKNNMPIEKDNKIYSIKISG